MPSMVQGNRYDRLSYFVSGFSALLYAWCISLTDYRQTGLQFVAPLLVIFVIQSIWCVLAFGITHSVFIRISRRTLQTALMVLIGVILFAALIPQPAHGSALGEMLGGLFSVIFCLVVIVVVGGIVGIGLWLVLKAGKKIYRLIKTTPDDDDEPRKLREVASIIISCVVLLAASVEGVKGAYSFDSFSKSSATKLINASEEMVWKTLSVATQPDFPLPALVKIFPHPVEVVVDEGVALNANRVVKFKGREGEGYLTLRVFDRTDNRARFQVLSDTSPISNWLAHRTLEYRVDKIGPATRLTVSLEYDRLLAPAWFFNALMGVATHLAMDVLARDVKTRAELRNQL